MPPVIRRLADYAPPVVPTIPRPRWTPPVPVPVPAIDASRLVRVALEVLDGRRPLQQLDGVAARPLLGRLRDRVLVRSTRLVRVRVSHPVRHVAEIAGVVRRGDRVLAVAACARLRGERWLLAEFDVIE